MRWSVSSPLGRCIAKFHAVKLRLQWSQTLVESACVHGRPRGVQFTPTSIIHHRRRCCCCRWPLSDYGDAVIVRVHCAVRRRPALQCAYKARLSCPLHLPPRALTITQRHRRQRLPFSLSPCAFSDNKPVFAARQRARSNRNRRL